VRGGDDVATTAFDRRLVYPKVGVVLRWNL
jgi:hypothetical protein